MKSKINSYKIFRVVTSISLLSVLFCIVCYGNFFYIKKIDTAVEKKEIDNENFNMESFINNNESEILYPEFENTEFEKKISNSESSILVKKLSEDITRVKIADGGWHRCGIVARKKDVDTIKKWSIEWSKSLIDGCEKIKKEGYEIDPYSVAALSIWESGMDECAIGPYVRKIAIRLNILPVRVGTSSKTKDEILTALYNSKVARTYSYSGVDIGACQVLSRFYSNDYTLEQMVTLDTSIFICISELSKRSKLSSRHKNTPWGFWPGSYNEKYNRNIKVIISRLKNEK